MELVKWWGVRDVKWQIPKSFWFVIETNCNLSLFTFRTFEWFFYLLICLHRSAAHRLNFQFKNVWTQIQRANEQRFDKSINRTSQMIHKWKHVLVIDEHEQWCTSNPYSTLQFSSNSRFWRWNEHHNSFCRKMQIKNENYVHSWI